MKNQSTKTITKPSKTKHQNRITPCLWFDDQAVAAAEFYTSIFDHSAINNTTYYPEAGHEIHGKEAGSVMTVEFYIENMSFTALNGGPHFNFTPAISFIVNCESIEEVDQLWDKLSRGGETLMPLDSYPFSERYGWTTDKYGLSWQLILSDSEGDWRPKIIPSLLFVGDKAGQAEEAMKFYTSVFDEANISQPINRYPAGMEPEKEGTIMYADFSIGEQWFAVMDSAREHHFTFNEAISFEVKCETQNEIDYFWEKFSAVPEAEQCGWLKDKFGISWQIVPKELPKLFGEDTENINRTMEAMLQMKKLNIEALRNA